MSDFLTSLIKNICEHKLAEMIGISFAMQVKIVEKDNEFNN